MNFPTLGATLLLSFAPELFALEAQSFQTQMTAAHNLAVSQGYVTGFPTFDCSARIDGGWMRTTCGTIMLTSVAAKYQLVKAFELGNPLPGDAGALLRAVNDFAASRGMAGFPTFGTSWQSGLQSYGVVLLN